MTTKSDPPSEDAERRGPVSIMPATDGIDSDWGAEPEVATASGGDSAATATLPETRSAAKVEVPAPAKVPVILLPEAESVRAATRSVGPPPKPSPPAPARSRAGGYIAVVGLLAAAGIWWTVRSPEPERPSAPVAVAPTPVVSATPATVDPAPTPSAAPAVAESAAPGASVAPSGSNAPSAADSAGTASSAAPAAAASAETGETIAVKINITPEGSKLTLKGEEVGKTPMTIELPRGERRVYEVVSKGYYPRRLVIDGTKTEVSYGLKPVEAQPAQ